MKDYTTTTGLNPLVLVIDEEGEVPLLVTLR